MNTRKPVTELSDRELLEEATEILRYVRGQLDEFAPLLAVFRGAGNGTPTYVQAAGLRRSLRRARTDGS